MPRSAPSGAETKNKDDQDLFIDMAKAWTKIALVESDVTKLASEELQKAGKPGRAFCRPPPRL
jgi:hypothetical protein